jgi:hypothetical protein
MLQDKQVEMSEHSKQLFLQGSQILLVFLKKVERQLMQVDEVMHSEHPVAHNVQFVYPTETKL